MTSLTLNPSWMLTEDGEIKFMVSSEANPDGELCHITVDRHDLLQALKEDVMDAYAANDDEALIDWGFFLDELKVFLEDSEAILK